MARNHYINNKDFLTEMTKYRQAVAKAKRKGEKKPQIPRYVAECFMKIAENLSHKPNFLSYTFRDEMVADAIENCVMYVDNFDPTKSSNPFAYFTQIVYYAFLRRIQKEKKQTYIKHKNFENSHLFCEIFEDSNHAMHLKSNEYSADVVRSYEDKLTKTKKPSKLVGVEKFSEVEEENEDSTAD